jgi:hypothetical protein
MPGRSADRDLTVGSGREEGAAQKPTPGLFGGVCVWNPSVEKIKNKKRKAFALQM